jgi:hypothetical protein
MGMKKLSTLIIIFVAIVIIIIMWQCYNDTAYIFGSIIIAAYLIFGIMEFITYKVALQTVRETTFKVVQFDVNTMDRQFLLGNGKPKWIGDAYRQVQSSIITLPICVDIITPMSKQQFFSVNDDWEKSALNKVSEYNYKEVMRIVMFQTTPF